MSPKNSYSDNKLNLIINLIKVSSKRDKLTLILLQRNEGKKHCISK